MDAARHPPRTSTPGFLCRQDGAAAAEFALMLPLLMLILFAAVEMGRLMHDYHVIQKSVRDATRYLTRVPVTCGGVTNAVDETSARNLALKGNAVATDADPSLLGYWDDPTTIGINVACFDNTAGTYGGVYGGVAGIPQITVTATVGFDFLFGTLIGSATRITLTASDRMVHIGE